MAKLSMKDVEKILAATFTGMSGDEFNGFASRSCLRRKQRINFVYLFLALVNLNSRMEIVMEKKAVWLKSMAMVMVLDILLAGCAMMQKSESMDTERLLAQSGFKLVSADTPKKLEHVKSLTQRKIIPHEYKGAHMYVYADATYCKCIYVGSEQAYHNYYKTLNKRNNENLNMEVMGAPEGFGRDAVP